MQVVGEKSGLTLAVVLGHAVTDEVAQQPGADDLQEVRRGGVGDARQGVEHWHADQGEASLQ